MNRLTVETRSMAQTLADPLVWQADGASGFPTTGRDWLARWYAAFARPERDPALVLRDASGAVAGLLPLVTATQGPLGMVRVLRSPTNGQAQYAALRLDADRLDLAALALLTALRRRPGWDFLHLQGLPLPEAEALARAARDLGMGVGQEHAFSHLVADLAGLRTGQLSLHMSGDTRRRKERHARALEREGGLRFETVRDPSALPAALEAYLEAEKTSWKAKDGELLTASPALAGFYRQMVEHPGPDEVPQIRFLRHEGRIIAGLLLYQAADEMVGLKTFFDPAHSRHSPGMLLLMRVVSDLMAEPGVARLNWYSGKSAFEGLATGRRAYRDLVIWGPGPRARIALGARHALHRLRASGGAGLAPEGQP